MEFFKLLATKSNSKINNYLLYNNYNNYNFEIHINDFKEDFKSFYLSQNFTKLSSSGDEALYFSSSFV